MEIDKRPFYIWGVVLLANIGVFFDVVLITIADWSFTTLSIFAFIISLFISVVPVLISKSNNKRKNYFGYGIPLLLSLPFSYFIYDFFTCTGKFCEITALSLFIAFGLSAIIFALFYAMGIYARKWNVKFILSVIWIEIILLISSALYFGAYIFN